MNRAITAGGSLGVALDEEQCAYLTAVIAVDLGCAGKIAGVPSSLPDFFAREPIALRVDGVGFLPIFETLVGLVPNADTYFDCLATLHKRRLKYQRILQTQPIPTLNQVGPRGLLQYGSLSTGALAGFLFWRKWIFDIDNRAGQETGYIFEPIVARCVGGEAYSANRSPVKRRDRAADGRQVDCIYDDRAYEIKMRVTVAASGQGRWAEEKDFPADCRASGYTPVLLVFDDTQADKLDELSAIFLREGGEVRVGQGAWEHLEELAGPTMSTFLEKYVRAPLKDLLDHAPERDRLPALTLSTDGSEIVIRVDNKMLTIRRPAAAGIAIEAEEDSLPDEASG